MGMWYILFGWFASLVLFKSRLMNFFRIQCTYDKGQYVQVEKAEPGKCTTEYDPMLSSDM